jgi:hypothetical protein
MRQRYAIALRPAASRAAQLRAIGEYGACSEQREPGELRDTAALIATTAARCPPSEPKGTQRSEHGARAIGEQRDHAAVIEPGPI